MTVEFMDITDVNITYLDDSKMHHVAQLITNFGRYYYREGDKTMEIEAWEYERVLANPRLYYFSRSHRNTRFSTKPTAVWTSARLRPLRTE